MTTTIKVCSTCKTAHPLNMFTKSTRTTDGHVTQCRSCRKAYVDNRRENPEVRAKEAEYSAQWYRSNQESKAAQTAAWRAANPEKARAAVNKYAAKNREAKRTADTARYWLDVEKSRAAGRAKYMQNSADCREATRKWRATNKESVRAWGRAWAQLNKEKYEVRAEHRRKLKAHMSEFDRFVMQEAAKLCILRQAATQIAWQIDHVTPLAKGGNHAAENLQVVPATWNAAKRDRHCGRYFG